MNNGLDILSPSPPSNIAYQRKVTPLNYFLNISGDHFQLRFRLWMLTIKGKCGFDGNYVFAFSVLTLDPLLTRIS